MEAIKTQADTAKTRKKLKILVMSAPIGSGHKMAARALAEALRSCPRTEVEEGDVFTFFPAGWGKAFLVFYKKVLSVCPGLYALSYRWGNRSGKSTFLRNGINRFLFYLGKRYLREVRPDIVLSTHATPTGILTLYKKHYAPDLWLGVAVTDFTVHRWLVCRGVDAYFVAAEPLRKIIEKQLPPGETPAIHALGIPVRKEFVHLPDGARSRRELRQRQGWPEEAFVCLVSGGGEGLLPMEELAGLLRQPGLEKLYMILVAGHNRALAQRLTRAVAFAGERGRVLGFTEEMPLLMAGADLLIGKAGGVSAAEALAAGSTLTVYAPLPGQEQVNSEFLQEHYGVRAIKDKRELAALLREEMALLPAERLRRQEKRRSAFGQPDAAEKIASYTLSFTDFFHI